MLKIIPDWVQFFWHFISHAKIIVLLVTSVNKLNVVLFFQNLNIYICFTHFFSLLQSNFFSQNISALFWEVLFISP